MQAITKYFTLIFIFSFSLTSLALEKTDPNNQSEELGKVTWYRNYDEALALAKKENKNVLILFQEVPGCSTCRNYGHNVLTHPLMVEAIENLFVPLAVYNNKGGKDREVLEKYGEPSWNNPVVRIVNADGKDIVDRIGGDYSATRLATAMQTALRSKRQSNPEYLQLMGLEMSAKKHNATKTKYYRMYCFWSGEKHFGALNGVLATEPGFMGGSEVVKVKFDTRLISEKELDTYAKSGSCEAVQNNGSYRIASSDVKYYLKKTNYKYLPLTPLQQTKINSAIGKGQSGEKYLSPKQLKWLKTISKNENKEVLYTKNFVQAWNKMR